MVTLYTIICEAPIVCQALCLGAQDGAQHLIGTRSVFVTNVIILHFKKDLDYAYGEWAKTYEQVIKCWERRHNLGSLPAPDTAPYNKGNHRPDFHGKSLYSSLNSSTL